MRAWLRQNKIYFEVFSSVVFGGASVLVAIAALIVSSEQLRLQSQLIQPHFLVSEILSPDSDQGSSAQIRLTAINIGPPKFGVRIRPTAYIVFQNKQSGVQDARVLSGYFSNIQQQGSDAGTSPTWSILEDREAYRRFTEALKSHPHWDNETYSTFVRVIVELSYKDQAEATHSVQFLNGVQTNGRAARVLDDVSQREEINIGNPSGGDIDAIIAQLDCQNRNPRRLACVASVGMGL